MQPTFGVANVTKKRTESIIIVYFYKKNSPTLMRVSEWGCMWCYEQAHLPFFFRTST